MNRFYINILLAFLMSAVCVYGYYLPSEFGKPYLASYSNAEKPNELYMFDTDIPQPSVVEPLTTKDILSYYLFCDFSREIETEYANRIEIDVRALSTLDSVMFDIVDNTIDSTYIDGVTCSFNREEEYVILYPEHTITRDDSFRVTIFYRGEFPSDGINAGFDSRSMLVIYSLFWPSIGRTFYPCVDHPGDKAISTLSLRFNRDYKVVANGNHLSSTIAEDDTMDMIHTWQMNYPITTYNVCFAASMNYAVFTDTAHTAETDIPLVYYGASNDTTAIKSEFDLVPEMVEFYDSTFGQYAFDGYGMYVTPFSAGAMEHQSMVLMGDYLVGSGGEYESMISHELSHQWWGDAVSIADWRDFYLNEGMAVYCEVLHAAHFYGYEEGLATLHATQEQYLLYSEYEGIFSMYDPDSYLSSTVYDKGACVFHMLHYELGDSLFFGAMASYFDTYKYSNVTSDSLRLFLEDYCDVELDWFWDQWIYEAGWPEFGYWFTQSHDTLFLTVDQLQGGDAYRVKMEVKVYADSIFNVTVDNFDSSDPITISGVSSEVTNVEIDPDGHILCEKRWLESIDETETLPQDFSMSCYPNPFNSTLNIDLSSEYQVSVVITDITGKIIEKHNNVSYNLGFTAEESGIYLISAFANDNLIYTEKVMLVK